MVSLENRGPQNETTFPAQKGKCAIRPKYMFLFNKKKQTNTTNQHTLYATPH